MNVHARAPLAAALTVAALSGCSLAVEPLGPPPGGLAAQPEGSLTVDWLVGGSRDPGACARAGAADLEVVVYDPGGRPSAHATAACESFSVTVPLLGGTYSADVTLVDPRGRSVSATKTLYALEIVEGTDLAVTVGF